MPTTARRTDGRRAPDFSTMSRTVSACGGVPRPVTARSGRRFASGEVPAGPVGRLPGRATAVVWNPFDVRRNRHVARQHCRPHHQARRHRTEPSVHLGRRRSLRRSRLGASRRANHELDRRVGGVRAARRRVPDHVVAERHQHRHAEVLPGVARLTRAGVVAEAGRRPHRRHDHRLGSRRRLLRRRRSRRVQRRTEVHPRHAAGCIQQPGVVQHRRRRSAAAGERLLHPRCRR